MTYFVLTRAKAAAHNLLIPTSQIAPSPVKSHQGMKQQQPLLWGMKAIELSFWSLMEQEGYCSGNGCGWAICHQPVLECVGGERKVTSTAAVCFTNDAHLLSLFTPVFVRFNCGTYICSPRLSFIARILYATIFLPNNKSWTMSLYYLWEKTRILKNWLCSQLFVDFIHGDNLNVVAETFNQ